MALNISKELETLRRMTGRELREFYERVFGEACRSRHRQWLIKRIVWRLQANAEGDLSERARRRAEELADDAELRLTAPVPRKRVPGAEITVADSPDNSRDPRIPLPGTILVRHYKGERLQVHVLDDGFEFEGATYQTLSAVAKAITGSHTSGFLFFRLNKKGDRS